MKIEKIENKQLNQTIFKIAVKQSSAPKFIESKKDDWVFYGEDNLFPDYLISLLQGSATHNAIVMNKVNLILGEGFKAFGLNVEDTAKIQKFINNPYGTEDLNKILKKCIFDYVVFGGFALEIIYSNDKKSIAQIEHIDFSTIRSGKINPQTGNVDYYYVSPNWNRRYVKDNEPKRLQAYNPDEIDESNQLLYVKPYFPGNTYYPLPSYIGAVKYIDVDVNTSEFHLNNIKNGMAPSMVVNFKSIPTEEEQYYIKQQLERELGGPSNAGTFICMFSPDKDSAPEFIPVQLNNADQLYTVLNQLAVQNIITGHQVTSPMLFGIKTEGQLGGNQELITAFNLYNTNVIKPAQMIFEEVFNNLALVNNIKADFKLNTKLPVAYSLSESVLLNILTQDELRTLIGYQPLNNINNNAN